MPNAGFIVDDRVETEYAMWSSGEPCMSNCKESVEITMRARVIDVTPELNGSSNIGTSDAGGRKSGAETGRNCC